VDKAVREKRVGKDTTL